MIDPLRMPDEVRRDADQLIRHVRTAWHDGPKLLDQPEDEEEPDDH